jgi:hypothetical protein
VTVHSASFKQDQTNFRARHHLVTCSASPNQPGVTVARNGTPVLMVVGKNLVARDNKIFADSSAKFIIFNLKNGVSDKLQLAESISDFHLIFNHLAP